MFNTFADVFNTDDNDRKQINGTNPFDISSTIDPFGISSQMKLSQSSEKFDDNPFIVSTNNNKPVRPRSGKDALSSSNWLAYQHSMDEANLDLQDTSSITDSTSINPFLIPTTSDGNLSNEISSHTSAIDLLFDMNIDPRIDSLTNCDDDFLGLNETNPSSVKVLKSDSLTDISPTKSSIPVVASYHSTPINVPPPSTLRPQTTPLTIATSNSPYDDQFLDWLTQSDDLMCAVDPKINGPSKKNDINMIKSTEDLLGSINRQTQVLSTLRKSKKGKIFLFIFSFLEETSQESVSSPPIIISQQLIRQLSNENLPSICIHEPTSDHNDSNIVPKGYFDKNQSDNDSDEDSKMVFKIRDKNHDPSNHNTNIPVPLLPPPPSKKYQEASDDASSSSSETDDENDPLAIFRSKPVQGNNWDESEPKIQPRVCFIVVCICLLLSSSSCLSDKSIRGWCCLIIPILVYI
jgi:hypothetical protein